MGGPGRKIAVLLTLTFATLLAGMFKITSSQPARKPAQAIPGAEFHFLRMEYVDLFNSRRGFGRGWWRQDWPEADIHFTQGVRRLTRIDIGEQNRLPLTDDRVFEYPWIYATHVIPGLKRPHFPR